MTNNEIKQHWLSDEWSDIRKRAEKYKIGFITVGGSVAYGTDTPTSDLDLRGCLFNTADEILLGNSFEQLCDSTTDTTLYSFNKLMRLWVSANPNTIELLGNTDDAYICMHPAMWVIIENKNMFLSRRIISSFYGYAYAQLRRLNNYLARNADDAKCAKHVLKSLEMMRKDGFSPYLTSENELFISVNVENQPWSEFSSNFEGYKATIKAYQNAGQRNLNAIEHNKLSKHMMHLLRLYMMAIDILEKHEINTKRVQEHDLLMSIRRGDYLVNDAPTEEFEEILSLYEKRLDYAKENTDLPENPDIKHINEIHAEINKQIVLGEI